MVQHEDPIRQMVTEARQAQILDAAAGLFAEKGFQRTTTREIAEQAGVSEGTIYNYFANKQDLLMGIMARMTRIDDFKEEVAEGVASPDPRKFFTAIIRERMEIANQNRQTVEALLPEILVNPDLAGRFFSEFIESTISLLETHLEARVAEGQLRPVDIPLTVRSLQATFVGLLLLRILGETVVLDRWDEFPQALADVYFQGLNPDQEG